MLALSRLAISPAKPIPPAESNQALVLNPVPPSARWIHHSKTQGRRLYNLLAQWNVLYVGLFNRPAITLLAPWGNGEAISQPSINQFDLFPRLNTNFYGPSIANITAMRQPRAQGVQANRVSTITVFNTKDNTDAFTGLFTGDAHDTILHPDIRGNLTAPQHFSVMKVPHHGSKHSESQEFYYQYTADVYLISSRFSIHGYFHSPCTLPSLRMPTDTDCEGNRLPTLKIMKELLEGCRRRGTQPIIITTSVYETSGIDRMVGSLTQDLLSTGAKMYFFKDGISSMDRYEDHGFGRQAWMPMGHQTLCGSLTRAQHHPDMEEWSAGNECGPAWHDGEAVIWLDENLEYLSMHLFYQLLGCLV